MASPRHPAVFVDVREGRERGLVPAGNDSTHRHDYMGCIVAEVLNHLTPEKNSVLRGILKLKGKEHLKLEVASLPRHRQDLL